MDETVPPGTFEHQGTLCYIVDGDEVLLIRKKRGIGEGLFNAPGGKIEARDTSPSAAAVREVREEVRVDVDDLQRVGILEFIFGDEPFMYGYVYTTTTYEGIPEETAEARPVWVPIDDLPFDHMWEDDRYWLPAVLDGKHVEARFRFDSDGAVLIDGTIDVTNPEV